MGLFSDFLNGGAGVRNKSTNKHRLPPADTGAKQTASSITARGSSPGLSSVRQIPFGLGAGELRPGTGVLQKGEDPGASTYWLCPRGDVTDYATMGLNDDAWYIRS